MRDARPHRVHSFAEQIVADDGAQHRHLGRAPDVRGGEEAPALDVPEADLGKLDVGALDGRVPVLPGRDDLVARADGGRQILRVGHPLADGIDVLGLEPRRLAHSHADSAPAGAAGADGDHVRAGGLDLGLDLLLRGLAEAHHRDDGGHADDHPQHREAGTHLVAAQRLERDTEDHEHDIF